MSGFPPEVRLESPAWGRGCSPRWSRAPRAPIPLTPNPSLAAATPPNAVDRPCLRLKVYVRPTSKCSGGRAGSRLSGQ